MASGRFRTLTSATVDALKWKELEVVLLVEPAALEEPDWQAGPAGEGQRIDRELNVGVFFFSRFRLVVEDVDVTVADLKEINMTGDNVALEIQIEAKSSVVGDILPSKKYWHFHCDGHGVIDKHEPLQSFVPLFVI